jgi:DNA-cytosine methyltransferase
MRILSLFDGCAGARQALDNLGIDCTYYSSEIDSFAIQIALKNYPDIIQLGDITKLDESNLPNEIDLLIGGSPCTSLSIAKRQKESGLEKGESMLFWEYVRVLKLVKPKYFILENVASMKKTDKDKISEILGVKPITINSSLLTAQLRKRHYWTNIPDLQQPEDLNIKLQDVLEDPDDLALDKKSYCVTATYSRASPRDYFNYGQRQLVFYYGRSLEGKNNRRLFKKVHGIDGGARNNKNREWVLKENQDKSPCLTSSTDARILDIAEEHWRKLTPIECEKLQGMRSNYTEGVSDTQRYKMIGNGFTIPVIEHLIKGISENKN